MARSADEDDRYRGMESKQSNPLLAHRILLSNESASLYRTNRGERNVNGSRAPAETQTTNIAEFTCHAKCSAGMIELSRMRSSAD